MEQASALWTYIIGVAWNSHRSGVPYAASVYDIGYPPAEGAEEGGDALEIPF